MIYILICLGFYAVLIFADIIPSIRQKQWKALKLSIPMLLITLAVQILYGLNVSLPNPNDFIKDAIQSMLHLK